MSAAKILIIGPPLGKVGEMVKKVEAIQKKYGPFIALFVLGQMFGNGETQEEEQLLDGTLQLPIQTYFYGNTNLDVSRVTNLHHLGKSGIYETPQGLRVAFCGGKWDASQWTSSSEQHLNQSDVQVLLDHPAFALPKPLPQSNQGGETLAAAKAQVQAQAASEEIAKSNAEIMAKRPIIDLLLTDYWPSNVTLFSGAKLPHDSARVWGCPPVANLAQAAAPRYHFALSPNDELVGLDAETRETGVFWEREPYLNDLGAGNLAGWAGKKAQSVTRFISLAKFGNAKKARWFMALNLIPGASPPKPSNTTPSPYFVSSEKKRTISDDSAPNFRWSQGTKKRKMDDETPPTGYVCKICSEEGHYIRSCPQKQTHSLPPKPKREAPIPVGPEDCWFCLSNPKCAKHLLVDIGEECYLALPRGQLPPSEEESTVPGGGHVLIVPMAHYGCIFDLETEVKNAVRSEMTRYRQGLRRVYAQFDCVPVAWEMGRSSGTRVGHTQMQVLPVPKHLAEQLVTAFEEAATFDYDDNKEGIDQFFKAGRGEDYFWIDLNGEERLFRLGYGERFNLQFARYMLANLLGVPDRADWKACALSTEEEKVETAAVYEKFSNA